MVYIVEARSTYWAPEVVNNMLLDNRWRRVHFEPSPIGVKNDAFSAEARNRDNFLGYKAAMALAHWFMANAERGYCLQTRLVKIKLESSYSTEEMGVGPAMALSGAEGAAAFTRRDNESESVDAVARTDGRVTG